MSPRRAAALRDGTGRTLREHLIATAERMIAEGGTAGLTVRAIAREAGVADGVLYNHFADKEELLGLALRAHVRSVEAGLHPLPEPGTGTLEENLRAHITYGLALHRGILPAMAGMVGRPEVMARFAASGVPGEDWRDRLLGYLRAERGLGRLAPGARVEAAATMIVGVCHEAVLTVLFAPSGQAPAAPGPDVDALVEVLLDGIKG
ncbi:TetR/AcrR family transcriptional regulator [Actinomadura sp. SCN-SB]|uniref:TetR/AcrR family transcriptional regulator n=1 Tax=Actinomadura sp. SCN-SB TaxID=3373092 RepID=UPI0037534AA3